MLSIDKVAKLLLSKFPNAWLRINSEPGIGTELIKVTMLEKIGDKVIALGYVEHNVNDAIERLYYEHVDFEVARQLAIQELTKNAN